MNMIQNTRLNVGGADKNLALLLVGKYILEQVPETIEDTFWSVLDVEGVLLEGFGTGDNCRDKGELGGGGGRRC